MKRNSLSGILAWAAWLLTLVSLVAALLGFAWVWLRIPTLHYDLLQFDRLTSFFILLILGTSLLACLQIYRSWSRSPNGIALWLLLSTFGAVLMVATSNLLLLVLAYELTTLTMFRGAGEASYGQHSDEVKLKYFVTAGVSTAFLLLGVAFLYALSGSLDLATIQEKLLFATDTIAVRLAMVCFLAGIAYKLAWVPFHFVVPDLYEGASTPLLGYLAVVSKLSGLAVLLHFINMWWYIENLPWTQLFTIAAVFCLLYGHLTSLVQTNLKRRLAFTSIGQIGFILAGLAVVRTSPAIQENVLAAVLFYSMAYSLMIAGSFAMVWALRTADNIPVEDSDYAGLARRAPWGAACLALFLSALAGLPPTIGFLGRFDLLNAVISADKIGLACVMLIAWILSAATYMPVVLAMFFKSSQREKAARISYPILIVVASCAILTLYWGIMPNTLIRIATESARALSY